MNWPEARAVTFARTRFRCEARTVHCWDIASHIHHKLSRKYREQRNDPDNLLALCAPCHKYVHEHPEESYAKGWLVKGTATPVCKFPGDIMGAR